jgi:hypothetical protein
MLKPRIIETRRGSAHGLVLGQAGKPRPLHGSA